MSNESTLPKGFYGSTVLKSLTGPENTEVIKHLTKIYDAIIEDKPTVIASSLGRIAKTLGINQDQMTKTIEWMKDFNDNLNYQLPRDDKDENIGKKKYLTHRPRPNVMDLN